MEVSYNTYKSCSDHGLLLRFKYKIYFYRMTRIVQDSVVRDIPVLVEQLVKKQTNHNKRQVGQCPLKGELLRTKSDFKNCGRHSSHESSPSCPPVPPERKGFGVKRVDKIRSKNGSLDRL